MKTYILLVFCIMNLCTVGLSTSYKTTSESKLTISYNYSTESNSDLILSAKNNKAMKPFCFYQNKESKIYSYKSLFFGPKQNNFLIHLYSKKENFVNIHAFCRLNENEIIIDYAIGSAEVLENNGRKIFYGTIPISLLKQCLTSSKYKFIHPISTDTYMFKLSKLIHANPKDEIKSISSNRNSFENNKIHIDIIDNISIDQLNLSYVFLENEISPTPLKKSRGRKDDKWLIAKDSLEEYFETYNKISDENPRVNLKFDNSIGNNDTAKYAVHIPVEAFNANIKLMGFEEFLTPVYFEGQVINNQPNGFGRLHLKPNSNTSSSYNFSNPFIQGEWTNGVLDTIIEFGNYQSITSRYYYSPGDVKKNIEFNKSSSHFYNRNTSKKIGSLNNETTTFYPDGSLKGVVGNTTNGNVFIDHIDIDIYFGVGYTPSRIYTGSVSMREVNWQIKDLLLQFEDTEYGHYKAKKENRITEILKSDTTTSEVKFDPYNQVYEKHGEEIVNTAEYTERNIYNMDIPISIERIDRKGKYKLEGKYDKSNKYWLTNVKIERSDDFIYKGNLNYEGKFVGSGKLYDPECEDWYSVNYDKKVETCGSFKRAWNDFWNNYNSIGEKFEEIICGKNNDNCHIGGGGVQFNTDGEIMLIDMNGVPAVLPEPESDRFRFFEEWLNEPTEFSNENEYILSFETEVYHFAYMTTNYEVPKEGIVPPISDSNGGFVCEIRPPDGYASQGGEFPARRGKTKPHAATDCIADPGEDVVAPISGTVKRLGKSYGDNDSRFEENELDIIKKDNKLSRSKAEYSLVVIDRGDGTTAKILYVSNPNVKKGDFVLQGSKIGKAADLQKIYPTKANGKSMKNHVHIEIKRNGYYHDLNFRYKAKCKTSNCKVTEVK